MASPLSRDLIVRTAVELIERDGVNAVSMRRLAAELGTGAMSLYNHLPNKAALLDAVAEYILVGMEFAADPAADWREAVRSLARAFREVAHRYPRSVMVVVSRQPNSTIGMRPVELALATAQAAGFRGKAAVQVMRAVVNYVLGCLVHESSQTEARWAADTRPLVDPAELEAAGLVNVRELLPALAEHDSEADFEFGLELLISALDALPRTAADAAGFTG
ncbi:TetR/AcrR family transcriptional regulator C-terminal domain-containing protein [Actinophytocola sp.]|uniref:TetR/AcrR family transcriptional regulator C-terminal domain-containing protein n=1 Tax=Actinophytocola sp. TaxID=1872138 RepID=UPI002D7F3863|nr:TetR/AcrR family transcriptional regulator C-terminal domain-containing protein [Actinophytocola sp.]HET9143411.1 TetR/AcrR family transcriptional regulator C-terminal domain-containing protein [Actinophytocola sp.]HEU5111603.1 TetR/AcrR family transcriptional regulator C-terminal domain-containing protein [Micromonosporaceae bacterium]